MNKKRMKSLRQMASLYKFTVLSALVLFVASIPVIKAAALTYSAGTYNSCTYNTCGISINSSNNISVNVTPTGSGSCSVNDDSVSVLTDSSTGYTLSMTTNSTSTSLSNGSSNIIADSGTLSSPASLGTNHWGYRVDGAGGFGSGPTTSQSNVSYPLSALFAGAPADNQTPATLVTSSSAADPAVTTLVWYGVCANNSLNSGLYSGQILYSATTN